MATDALIERIRRAASPNLRRRLAAAGVEVSRVGVDDLDRLPPIRRADLDLDALDDPAGELRLTDAPSPVRLGTSGRDGATVVLSWTARDLARTATTGAVMLRRAGIGPGMRVANTLEGGFATPGSLVLGDALEALGALDVPLGPVRDDRAAEAGRALLERVGIEALVVDDDTAGPLLDRLAERPLRSLTRILRCAARPGRTPFPGRVERWLSLPEASVFAATSCARGLLHVDPGLRVEIVEGRLVVTARQGDAPVFRLDTGLSVEALADGCACGEGGPTLHEGAAAPRI